MSLHNLMVNEMLDIRRKVSEAWAMDLDAWSRDRTALEVAVREANNRTAEVLELRQACDAANEVGVRQIKEIEKLKEQLKQRYEDVVASADTPGVFPPHSDGADLRIIEPEGETECYNHTEAEAKASGAREVYMREAVPGPPPVPFEKLKPHCQIGWFKVVEFIEHPLLVELDVLRKRLAAREAALKDAVDTLNRAKFQYNPEAEIHWKPPVNEAATKLHNVEQYVQEAVDAVQSAAAEIVNDLRLGEHAPSRSYDETIKRKGEMIDE